MTEEGNKGVESNTLGLVAQPIVNRPAEISRLTNQCPWILALLNMYIMTRNGDDTKWTSICVNKDVMSPIHKDRNNQGPSMILAVGDFTGGGLKVWDEGVRRDKVHETPHTLLDPRRVKPFNGRRFHATENMKDGA